MQDIGALVGRIALAHIFVLAGLQKIGGYAGTIAYMQSHGVPGWLLPGVIALELAAGLAVVLGWYTRITAGLLAIFAVAAALIFHHDFSEGQNLIMLMKDLAMAGGLLYVVCYGAGRWSLDRWIASW